MATATEERLGEMRRRIDRLEAKAQSSEADARSRMQRQVDTLREEQESARSSARRHAGAVEEKLDELDTELDIAEHRMAAELADNHEKFVVAVEAELADWDAYLERLQAKTAAATARTRARVEETVAELRHRRLAVAETLAGVGTATAASWREAKARILASLDELKRKADDARDD